MAHPFMALQRKDMTINTMNFYIIFPKSHLPIQFCGVVLSSSLHFEILKTGCRGDFSFFATIMFLSYITSSLCLGN